MTNSKSIDIQTRREIRNLLLEWGWNGTQGELLFLSELYDLHELPSHDRRYPTAYEDIDQHLRWNDWDEGWVFADPRFKFLNGADETVLQFVAHTLHPRVRKDSHREPLLEGLNELLTPCGYELYELPGRAGLTKFSYRSTTSFHPPQPQPMVSNSAQLGDPESLQVHLKRIEASLETDPGLAIGSSKELIEDVIAQILNDRGVKIGSSDNLGQKFKAAAAALDLPTTAVPGDPKASEAVVGIVRGLTSVTHSLGDLRNAAGTGHGSGKVSPATRREARLAFNAAITVCEYLFGAWEEYNASGT